jgi:hypothetical protein
MLIRCPECGEQISDQVETCPHCGAPTTINVRPCPEHVRTHSQDEGVKAKHRGVWGRIVLVIYLVAVVGVCLYVPTYEGTSLAAGSLRTGCSYRWVWDLRSSLDFYYGSLVDYGRVALEVVSLTAIAGVLLLIGSFVAGRKQKHEAGEG